MLIGVPTEIKNQEHRVALTPSGVRELVSNGHRVVVQRGAGLGAGFSDDEFVQSGAGLAADAAEVFGNADIVVKVKEPQASECALLRVGQTLFTYLHLAAAAELTTLLQRSGATCIAYETITDSAGNLPLLAPMSEVAGRLAVQKAALCMESSAGGNGILLGGVPGTPAAHVVVLGGGVVGLNAARMALGLGAKVTIIDRSLERLKQIDERFEGRFATLYSTTENIEQQLALADLVIGAVLIPGASAPKLVSKAMLKLMKPCAVMVDVAIDQGGCFETSRPTTHDDPSYVIDGIIHYCVANMPGAVARTSTQALTNATLPYLLELANLGPRQAMLANPNLLAGLNIHAGFVCNASVAKSLSLESLPPQEALSSNTLLKSA